MTSRFRLIVVLFITALMIPGSLHSASREPKQFRNWPTGNSPEEIGNRVAARFLATPHTNFGRPTPPEHITYPEVATWYGAMTFAQVTHAKTLEGQLAERFEPLFGPEAHLIPQPVHVDNTVFGAVPLELSILTTQKRYLELGLKLADAQWADPRPDGLTSQSRYWIDDMYMITIVQMEAYRATGDKKYLDHAALEMAAYLDKLQQPSGLFYHAPDVPFYWGRGDGWVAAGMAEVLSDLPTDHPQRARIMAGYQKMMKALLDYQDKSGMWHQLIDHPESYPETSSTGMFTFAMVTGVKQGWLNAKIYAPASRKAWLALIGYMDPNGDIRNVCRGTNKQNELQYYLDRPMITGDLHGQAPLLWAATAFLR